MVIILARIKSSFISDSITLVGKQEVIDSVIELLDEKKKGWEANAEDRALRNYSEIIEVHQMFHPKIIGQKVFLLFKNYDRYYFQGAVINKLQSEINARITMPSDKNKDLAPVSSLLY